MASEGPLFGDALLAGITDAMLAFHERYHHRPPVTARTLLLGDDLLSRTPQPRDLKPPAA